MPEFSYEIEQKIAVLSTNRSGNYTLELNKISFNGGPAKLDIRKWNNSDPENRKMLKGLTLTDQEAAELKAALNKIKFKAKKGE